MSAWCIAGAGHVQDLGALCSGQVARCGTRNLEELNRAHVAVAPPYLAKGAMLPMIFDSGLPYTHSG